jgi:hypothetical protein
MAKAKLNGQEIFGNVHLGEGGGSYTETTLYNTWTAFAINSTISLSDDADNYDAIVLYTSYNERGDGQNYYTHYGRCIIPKNDILKSIDETPNGLTYSGFVDVIGSVSDFTQFYMCWNFNMPNKTTLTSKYKATGSWSAGQCGIYKITGIKFT